MQNVFRPIIGWYLGLPFWLKVTFSVLGGGVFGSLFMGLLSNYATYLYALRYGARVPVEGVPFINLAVGIVSFSIIVGSLASILLLYLGIASVGYLLRGYFHIRQIGPDKLGSVSFRLLLVFNLVFAVISLLHSFGLRPINPNHWVFYAVLFGQGNLIFLMAVLVASRRRLNFFLSSAYLAVFVFLSVSMFIEGVYESFLRIIRFGGGIQVILTGKLRGDGETASAYLFIITQEAIVLYDSAKNEFIERKRSDVDSYRYAASPNWALPEAKLRNQVNLVAGKKR